MSGRGARVAVPRPSTEPAVIELVPIATCLEGPSLIAGLAGFGSKFGSYVGSCSGSEAGVPGR